MWRGAQAVGFALVQARELRHLPGGVEVLDLGAVGGGAAGAAPAGHLTSVVRVPADLGEALAAATRALPGAVGHYLYPAGQLHLTVLNLDGLNLDGRPLGRSPLGAVAAVVGRAAPFPVLLAGFGVSRTSVYVRAYDPTASLRRLRTRLVRATGCRPPLPLRLLGFVNVLRFSGFDVRELLAGLASIRDRGPASGIRATPGPRGELAAREVEIVRTDKVLSPAGTVLLRRVALGGPATGGALGGGSSTSPCAWPAGPGQ